jgi:hypothetical protein
MSHVHKFPTYTDPLHKYNKYLFNVRGCVPENSNVVLEEQGMEAEFLILIN